VDLIVPARKVRIREAWVGEAGADVEEAWLRDGGYANGWRGDGLCRGEGAHVVVGYRVQFVSAGQVRRRARDKMGRAAAGLRCRTDRSI
jgi:hypothetical protein